MSNPGGRRYWADNTQPDDRARIRELEREVKRLKRCSVCSHEEYFVCGECQAHMVYPRGNDENTD